MKKSLVLAMAMALGVTASAYAANPFSDVPAGHWAYDSISKLAAAGIIEGYGDDTFRGDRLMTRYEMAQIVAKALAKGANVDRLAAEFADELDALGVRVAALEKKADNVKITGNVRYHWARVSLRGNKSADSQLRTRLTFTGKVNDNWNYVSMLENRQIFHNEAAGNDRAGDERTDFQRAYLDGRLGGTKAKLGRFNLTRGVEGDIYDNRFDGVQFVYGDKVKLGAYYGKTAGWRWQNGAGNQFNNKKAWGINAEGKIGDKITLFAGYDKFETDKTVAPGADDRGIFEVGAKGQFNDFRVAGAYLHSSQDRDFNGRKAAKKGAWVTLGYKGAKAAQVGSWGVEAKYYHLGNGTVVSHTFNATTPADNAVRGNKGFKGYKLAAYYTVAKNMVAGVEWYDLKGLGGPKDKAKTAWTQMIVTF